MYVFAIIFREQLGQTVPAFKSVTESMWTLLLYGAAVAERAGGAPSSQSLLQVQDQQSEDDTEKVSLHTGDKKLATRKVILRLRSQP